MLQRLWTGSDIRNHCEPILRRFAGLRFILGRMYRTDGVAGQSRSLIADEASFARILRDVGE